MCVRTCVRMCVRACVCVREFSNNPAQCIWHDAGTDGTTNEARCPPQTQHPHASRPNDNRQCFSIVPSKILTPCVLDCEEVEHVDIMKHAQLSVYECREHTKLSTTPKYTNLRTLVRTNRNFVRFAKVSIKADSKFHVTNCFEKVRQTNQVKSGPKVVASVQSSQ